MVSLTPWIETIIFGFIDVITIFFFYLLMARIKKLDFLQNIDKNVLPYVSIVLIFTSFVIGSSTELIGEKIVSSAFKEYEYSALREIAIKDNAPASEYESYGATHGKLIFYRHLFFSFFFLTIVLSFWLHYSHYNKYILPTISLLFFTVLLFCISWYIQHGIVEQIKCVLRKYAP